MIETGYTGFLESVAFDTGYRRACSDILEILERAEWTRIIKREGMELLRVLCVPENLESVATGDADIFVRHSSMAKDGKERFHLERRKTAVLREKISQTDTECLETCRKGGKE